MNITGAALVLAGVLTLPAAVYLLWWGTRSPAVVRQTPRQPLLAAVTCLITGSWVTAAAAQMQEQAAFAPNVAIGCAAAATALGVFAGYASQPPGHARHQGVQMTCTTRRGWRPRGARGSDRSPR